MRQTLLSILAGLALIASACGPSAQTPGASGPGNVTVATPPAAAGGAATPSGATTPSGAATPATSAPTAGATAQPTTKPQANAQPSGPQEITVNALQGEP